MKKKNKLYTFSPSLNNKEYLIFDGEKELNFTNPFSFFEYLINEEEQGNKITLFGHNVLNHGVLAPLIQEALLKGYRPHLFGGEKIVSCYLKGNQIIIKDTKNFYLGKSEITEQLDKLYEIIQDLERKIKKKHKTSIIEDVSTLSKVS
jgi:hypothetical protein